MKEIPCKFCCWKFHPIAQFRCPAYDISNHWTSEKFIIPPTVRPNTFQSGTAVRLATDGDNFPWNARTFRPKCPYVSSNRKGGSVIPDWQSSQRRRRWKPHFVLPARFIPVRGRACDRIPWYWWGIKAIN